MDLLTLRTSYSIALTIDPNGHFDEFRLLLKVYSVAMGWTDGTTFMGRRKHAGQPPIYLYIPL